MRRYRSPDEDSGRWASFPFREGDVVVSSRSKHGTTWVQAICAFLVHGSPDLPEPLATLSPWLDWRGEPIGAVVDRLEAQPYRRVVKTHTPLDGLPLDPRATFVVVARHPLDAAVSLYHQGANLDRRRVAALTGSPLVEREPRSLDDWLRAWIDDDPPADEAMDSLPGVAHHLSDAWGRRRAGNVVLLHYADLWADRAAEMARLADRLGVAAPGPDLVVAAGLDAMRARADELAPDAGGVLKDPGAFFRRGGSSRADLPPDLVAAYDARVAGSLPPDLSAWLHRPP